MSTRQNIADDAQRHLLGVEECVAKLASWPDAAQAQPPATNKPRSAISALASEWILKHGMAPAFKSELRAFARWAQKRGRRM